MSYASAEHDRMIAAMLMPCVVVGVDLTAPAVRVGNGEWTSAWVRWHSLAAGKARHWRAPSLGEQGLLFNPSGQAGMGTFIPGLYGNAGAAPDNRDHVEVWRFDDGGSLIYDWEANTYTITLPTGTVTIKVGTTTVTVTDNAVTAKVGDSEVGLTPGALTVRSAQIAFTGAVEIDGPLHVTQSITGDADILAAGNSDNHHKH
ncbi:phage baseplate assembly protein V [Pseudomonas antarctica]|uniref:Phage baseplate assembly protein V n=1 Tax=Pseudomonas antarctica TaxID=219572 RepID=A0A1H0BDY0_9PSED|nr:phage baseplate assembly protein V [Pseudomonas antarctica]KAF2406418.1 phage-related baseplate assembly protein [Pseudomonas antarctica]SDN43827.1 phage baseplate assembly protein V [Pseudomonas antarctica]